MVRGRLVAIAPPEKTTLMFGDLLALDSATDIARLATQYSSTITRQRNNTLAR
ncbi:MAG: hypothetical protein F6K30_07230 [Cyanothece sp. SIO2G6]|nr:hypothetical protein [Cyanothece sp. SIO2G6]